MGPPKAFNEHFAILVRSRLQVLRHISCCSRLHLSGFSVRLLRKRAVGLADISRILFSVKPTIIINFKNFTKFILLKWFASAQLWLFFKQLLWWLVQIFWLLYIPFRFSLLPNRNKKKSTTTNIQTTYVTRLLRFIKVSGITLINVLFKGFGLLLIDSNPLNKTTVLLPLVKSKYHLATC